METNNGPEDSPDAGSGMPPSAPAMPSVPPDELYVGALFLLLEGLRHSAGWQNRRRSGPSFVVTRRRPLGSIKVLERFPLSEQGWADAWRALSRLNQDAAAAVEVKLAELAARRRAAEALSVLDTGSLSCLRSVIFDGESDRGPLTKGEHYDLRFQDDRIIVCAPRAARAFLEMQYADVETVEVSGPANQRIGPVLGLISGLGLIGALVGFLVLGLFGLLLGAVVLGLVGGVIGAATSRNETIIRVRGRDAEFQFLDPVRRTDDVRRALSEPLVAIRKANAAPDASNAPAEPASGSVADQLTKLASLLQQNLITRDEFEHLKANVIAEM
ncbi:MAG TPA: SHOCT domain-containing protein [Streptosporangiaceae bacterium]|nr:SHOCT domain-containing protein [Streptosporangiaceae bacterium]